MSGIYYRGLQTRVVLGVRPMGRGDEGKKKFVYLKWASHFWISLKMPFFPRKKYVLILGGWLVWPEWVVHRITRPPPRWATRKLLCGGGGGGCVTWMPGRRGGGWRNGVPCRALCFV